MLHGLILSLDSLDSNHCVFFCVSVVVAAAAAVAGVVVWCCRV